MENNTFDVDFDLPEVVDVPLSNQPRIHIAGDSVCISCEG
jgi:hypothetical protein